MKKFKAFYVLHLSWIVVGMFLFFLAIYKIALTLKSKVILILVICVSFYLILKVVVKLVFYIKNFSINLEFKEDSIYCETLRRKSVEIEWKNVRVISEEITDGGDNKILVLHSKESQNKIYISSFFFPNLKEIDEAMTEKCNEYQICRINLGKSHWEVKGAKFGT